jgi:hypothetical protein
MSLLFEPVAKQFDVRSSDVVERPLLDSFLKCVVPGHSGEWESRGGRHEVRRCPFGVPGDRLWVREQFSVSAHGTDDIVVQYSDGCQRALGAASGDVPDDDVATYYRLHDLSDRSQRRSVAVAATQMPKWASRLSLEVTGVRVMRVQSITDQDARAAGIEDQRVRLGGGEREEFSGRWDSSRRNPKFRWAANPWVWGVSFKIFNEPNIAR